MFSEQPVVSPRWMSSTLKHSTMAPMVHNETVRCLRINLTLSSHRPCSAHLPFLLHLSLFLSLSRLFLISFSDHHNLISDFPAPTPSAGPPNAFPSATARQYGAICWYFALGHQRHRGRTAACRRSEPTLPRDIDNGTLCQRRQLGTKQIPSSCSSAGPFEAPLGKRRTT